MNVSDLAEVWTLIKPSIVDGDVNEASDLLINHLIDGGHSAIELKKAFGDDESITAALSYFTDVDVDDNDDEDEDDTDDNWD